MRRILLLIPTIVVLMLSGTPAAASPTSASEPPWSWPVAEPHTVIRPYLAPPTAYAAGHRGIDIAATGEVTAPVDGVVHFAGFVVDRPVLSIAHAGEVISSYEPVASSLHAGDIVTRGELIGTVQPGHCTRLCLHFGARIKGLYVSPMLFLGGIPRSVLLPTRRIVE